MSGVDPLFGFRLPESWPPKSVEKPLGLRHWFGFLTSWFVLAFAVTVLYVGFMRVLEVGGYCAEGGPYVIETHCPPGTIAAIPLSIFGLFIAAGLSFLAGGLGTPAYAYLWTILFGSLGTGFAIAAKKSPDGAVGWIICAVMFILMAVSPLIVIVKTAPRSMLGSRRLNGARYPENRVGVKDGMPTADAAVIVGIVAILVLTGIFAGLKVW